MATMKKDAELEVSGSGVSQAPQPIKADFPQTFVNRAGVQRVVYTAAQQVSAEYDGYTAK